ncbi:MAG: aldolase [Deltaproteobacteria bacterium]|nr:aldolase [Deltaproteobacteria bacterium]
MRRFIVDWESKGKAERQRGFDTQVNQHGVAELRALRQAVDGHVSCRLNELGPWSAAEVDQAVEAGATTLFLPMVKSPRQVEVFLHLLDGRAEAAILVETPQACARARELATFPLSMVYVGLNDLAIARGSHSIFEALVDGTVDRIREAFASHALGVAGLTRLDAGAPVPFTLLLAALERLDCRFTFARRSFQRDFAQRDIAPELARIELAWDALRLRTASERQAAHTRLAAAIRDDVRRHQVTGP